LWTSPTVTHRAGSFQSLQFAGQGACAVPPVAERAPATTTAARIPNSLPVLVFIASSLAPKPTPAPAAERPENKRLKGLSFPSIPTSRDSGDPLLSTHKHNWTKSREHVEQSIPAGH